jgi:hypothetical protein
MKSPLLPLRVNFESAALLDRGGRPTLRELLGGLEFDVATGALRLNGERVTLQTAAADRILRRELIQMMGEEEARIFLLRRGFMMGQSDAAFVARSWPALDRGDVFTAGTRLHMFSGIVRVETLHNDFDFARGRFSAEFMWHNSIEADTRDTLPHPPEAPQCWQQLGYASGYASFFFGAPVVYKETACKAQGHRAYRVVGRLASGWGEEDPDVILFRTRILPPAPVARPRSPHGNPMPAAVEAVLLAPVLRGLEQAARLPLPCLIAGAGSCGQEAAAAHLIRLTGRTEPPLRLRGCATGPDELRAALAQQRKPRRKDTGPYILLDGIESLSPATQAELAQELSDSDSTARPALVATAALPLARLAAGGLEPQLWVRLLPLAQELPALSTRAHDLPSLAAALLGRLANQIGLDPPRVEPDALAGVAALPSVGGLAGLEALLTRLLIDTMEGQPITLALVQSLGKKMVPMAAPNSPDATIDDWISARIAEGNFSLEAHEARIRRAALARAEGNFSAAARLLGISRAQLAYREKTPDA